MNTASNTHPVTEFDISGLEAMLAGTLCLMSAYSHGKCDQTNNQSLISLKIVSNLTCLQCQSSLSSEFRRVLAKVCESWRQHSLLSQPSSTSCQSAKPENMLLWHKAPSSVH